MQLEIDNLETFAKDLADLVKERIAAATQPLREQIAELRRKLVEVQAKGVEYRGVYQRACDYPRGSITTHGNDLWVAVEDVAPNVQPGKSHGWQLACRGPRERDARDRGAAAA